MKYEQTVYNKEVIGQNDEFFPQTCISKKCLTMRQYIKEVNRRINVDKQNKMLLKENILYQTALDSLSAMIRDLVNPNYPAIEFVRERLSDITKVYKAYYFVSEDIINIWVVTEDEDFDSEIEIADMFRELMVIFKNLKFDYMVIPKYNIALEEIMPKEATVIYSKI